MRRAPGSSPLTSTRLAARGTRIPRSATAPERSPATFLLISVASRIGPVPRGLELSADAENDDEVEDPSSRRHRREPRVRGIDNGRQEPDGGGRPPPPREGPRTGHQQWGAVRDLRDRGQARIRGYV